MPLALSTPLEQCPFISVKAITALKPLHIFNIEDLLRRPPKRHENRLLFDKVTEGDSNDALCLKVHVIGGTWKYAGPRRYYDLMVKDLNSPLETRISCRWFHFPGISKILAAGMTLIVYGKVKRLGKAQTIIHPEFEILDEQGQDELIHLNRIVPIYRNTGGLSPRIYREIIWNILAQLDKEKTDSGPQKNLSFALKQLHYPDNLELNAKARRYFALEECFHRQLTLLYKKYHHRAKPGLITATKTTLLKDLNEQLPFSLTESQKKCVREIFRDMKLPHPMNRLLQGDVGSGKTLVSLCAALLAIESGFQVAFMAPTQILAEQHFKTAHRVLDPLGIKIMLKTSDKIEETQGWGPSTPPQIIIGTHALLYGESIFQNLGLVIIDEQHKFGVEQRKKLINQGNNPDVLVMTATPIPRTLTMTLYGNLDVSFLTEKPQNRGKITTAIRKEKDLSKIILFLRNEIEQGHQVFIVAPLIEESEKKTKTSSALKELELWQERLPHIDIGLVHGKMNAEEKESIMRDFRNNKYSVLVSTTVIEVGVDIPNASVMIIHNADQFGLSQLHQLRGRIGRGSLNSYCILLTHLKATEENYQKLEQFSQIQDGFKLSEIDFQWRGPGELFGSAQSGLSDVHFPEWLYNTELIEKAKEKADSILKSDPHLTLSEHADYRSIVLENLIHDPETA